MHTVHLPQNRVEALAPILSPDQLSAAAPLSSDSARLVEQARSEVTDILASRDDRTILITGPCSVDDPEAALEYASRLAPLATRHQDELLVLMRVYVEKPRSRLGWKGLAMDPSLDESNDINAGLLKSRQVMTQVLDQGLPIATEFLDPALSWHLADLVSWGAIGARTTQSQPHRQLASGLGMPIGIKNPTSGRIEDAVDAIVAAASPHVFPGIASDGTLAALRSLGNSNCHVVLRGCEGGPNYGADAVMKTVQLLQSSRLPTRVILDASHGNSGKCHRRQTAVSLEIADRIALGEDAIAGVMLESYLRDGRQEISNHGTPEHVFGQSITDACIDWDTTVELTTRFAAAVRQHRNLPHDLFTLPVAN